MAQLELPVLTASPPPGAPLEGRGPDVRFLAWPARTVLNPPASTRMPFWTINPYVGCEFGCGYCYARDTHRWATERVLGGPAPPGRDPDDAFEEEILVKLGATAVLARTLRPAQLAGTPIVIGSATDPYQPAERRFGLTRQVLETLARWDGLHIGLITKSPLITRDTDLLARLAERHRLTVHLSLATLDRRLLRRLERRSPGPRARLRAMRRLRAAEVRVELLIAPVLPGITDGLRALNALMLAARASGALDVGAGALRLGPASRRRFLPLLAREFPDLLPRYERAYARGSNAPRAYRRALERRLDLLRRRNGFPVACHMEP